MIINFWGREIKANVVVGAIGAFFVAVASSMFGFGGGPFMVPLMTVVLGLPMYVVVGSSLLAILFNTLMATSKNLFFETVDFKLFAIMGDSGRHRRLSWTADREAHQPRVGEARGRGASSRPRNAALRLVGVDFFLCSEGSMNRGRGETGERGDGFSRHLFSDSPLHRFSVSSMA